MNKVSKDIFKAIYEGKWVAVEYKNKSGDTTNYWIGIKDIITNKEMLLVEGLNVASLEHKELNLYFSSIVNTNIIDGSFFPKNDQLIYDIENKPSRYTFIFQNVTNLKLLDYYSECNKLDNTPYKQDYSLIDDIDIESVGENGCKLNDEQFAAIVKTFNREAKNSSKTRLPKICSLCVNMCSVHTKNGLYVLAYRKLLLDVQKKMLVPDEDTIISNEFTMDGVKMSIGNFLDSEDMALIENFDKNAETIKDIITKNHPEYGGVDDMPYIMALARDCTINLDEEYEAILEMYNSENVSFPIKAFFGDLTSKPRRIKDYPIALYNNKVNLDQLLAIHNAIKYPVLYVQGPPGSGKTNTILNTVLTAFFNEKKVLITSYNNHPIDEIYHKLSNLKYSNGTTIPFPIIRLGNNECVKEAILQIRSLVKAASKMQVFETSLDRKKDGEEKRTAKLSAALRKYEEYIDLTERKEMIETMLSSSSNLTLNTDLQGNQLRQIKEQLEQIGDINNETISGLIKHDRAELLKYLNFTSAKFIKMLNEPKFKELMSIINEEDLDSATERFNRYLSNDTNLKSFLRVFPIVATTNISAHKLGEPKNYFDMVIMDEASQCDSAIALVPILRGSSLMLVGDPQQLNPVILLDEKTNEILKKKYRVSDEYDYRNKSVYQTFLSADAASDEVLLSYHYRCHPKIIEFNNRKYYNNKLNVRSVAKNDDPLEFIDCHSEDVFTKNTSEAEVQAIVDYVKKHPNKNIAVITPFVNQRKLIKDQFEKNGITKVDCGTVHAFQGDEKQEIIFSLAITQKTGDKTYDWLKNNKELINVATSRAQEKLIIIGDMDQIHRLNKPDSDDDLFELINYVRTNGKSTVTLREPKSRALGIKPYSTETESAFLETLSHAINSMTIAKSRYSVKREVAISQVFSTTTEINDLFYTGRFDFVVYENVGKKQLPVFALELDGNEHEEDPLVIARDNKKQRICQEHNFELVRVPNNYARRYNYVKDILSTFFGGVK